MLRLAGLWGLQGRFACRVWLVVGLVLVVCGVVCGPVLAVEPAPAWEVTTATIPSVLPPGLGRIAKYDVLVENTGAAASTGEVTVTDELPVGLTVRKVSAEPAEEEPECPVKSEREIVCHFFGPVNPGGVIALEIEAEVTGTVGGLTNVVGVSGGGAPAVSNEASAQVGVGKERGPVGVSRFGFHVTGLAGEPFTQAAGHPHFLATSLLVNNILVEHVQREVNPVEAVKDLAFYLPLGFLGDPSVADPCPASLVQLHKETSACPPSSRVGSILPLILGNVFAETSDATHIHGLYSMAPEKGYPAEFAFGADGITFFVYASVVWRDGAYMLRIATPGVPALASLIGLVATFDGDITENYLSGSSEFTADRGAFLTNPSNCQEGTAAREAWVEMDTWDHPGVMFPKSALAFPQLTGCEQLGFSAALNVVPQTTQADEPSGYEIGLKFPQAPNSGFGLATPPLKNASVTLPAGTTVSPSSANGLQACPEVGPTGFNIEGAESEVVASDGLERPAAGHCPVASRLGSVRASSPLLREELSGHLFLASPHCGGAGQHECSNTDAEDGGLFGLYMELEAPNTGVVIKLQGKASVNAVSGQITATFEENPQFPLTKLTVSMNGGARAPLANPQGCGGALTQGAMTSWAEPYTPEARPSDFFNVDWNGAGGACPATVPLSPSFTAETVPVAGATSPFTLTLKREDREQDIQSLSSTLPEGLLANVSKVGQCPEALASQASLSACPQSSLVGSTTVAVGPGNDPYYVAGKVFFTGPYGGAPFGLSVVVPAVAGPFNLGNVLVRVALFIDPHTAQVTAVSGPLPQILDGVPLRIRTIQLTIDAREFTLNPTSCSQLAVTGTVRSTSGATAGVSSPFAVAGCKSLQFKPALSGSTEAKSTKANGTGVKIKIAYPASGEANIAKVVVGFPTQLPVRLSTLQQACRAVVFEANPAACPSGSNVGSAVAHTPILNQPLAGPAYLVSYGSAKFPDVVFVLQGEGVRLDVDGQSFVSSKGALRVTFPSVPDAPFSTFETTLPAGRYSQFTSTRSTGRAQASQCGEDLKAPVTMVSHSGVSLKENVQLQVTGCKAARPKVTLVKSSASASGLTVTVKTSVRGRVSISSGAVRMLVKKNVGPGVHRYTLALTGAGKLASRDHKKTQITVGLVAGKQKASKQQTVVL